MGSWRLYRHLCQCRLNASRMLPTLTIIRPSASATPIFNKDQADYSYLTSTSSNNNIFLSRNPNVPSWRRRQKETTATGMVMQAAPGPGGRWLTRGSLWDKAAHGLSAWRYISHSYCCSLNFGLRGRRPAGPFKVKAPSTFFRLKQTASKWPELCRHSGLQNDTNVPYECNARTRPKGEGSIKVRNLTEEDRVTNLFLPSPSKQKI